MPREIDGVPTFGHDGGYNQFSALVLVPIVRAKEMLPLLWGFANRPGFMGHRTGPYLTSALSLDVVAMRVP